MTKDEDKKLQELVYGYKTHDNHGFIGEEIELLIDEMTKKYPNFSRKHFDDAMMGNTCMMVTYKGKPRLVNYHCDVLTGLRCGIDNRGQYGYEFD